MADWLGTKEGIKRTPTLGSRWRSFSAARNFARSLGIKKIADWHAYCRNQIPKLGTKPRDIPVQPNAVYKGFGWKNWYDWLGTSETWRPFLRAREYIRGVGLKSNTEWRAYLKGQVPDPDPIPDDIPRHPEVSYRNLGWKSWQDWLGNEMNWRAFEEARAFARSLGLTSTTDWKAYCRGHLKNLEPRPKDIPSQPYTIYKKDGWISFTDWLQTPNDDS